jgi:4-aminobutyrate aminotransferase-like enzyme/Ser/Thr protein kinase RdoA (MazF antagonist)
VIDLPAFGVQLVDAERVLRERYDLSGRLSELGSQQDANFLVTTASGQRYVLKFSNPGISATELTLQHQAMRHVVAVGCTFAVPEVVVGTDGAELQPVDIAGTQVLARMVTYLPGRPGIGSRYLAPPVAAGLGRLAAQVAASLSTFHSPAATRRLQWDLQLAATVVEELVHFVKDPVRRRQLLSAASRSQEALGALAPLLPTQVIHADIADNNVVFDAADDGRFLPTGVFDFGDVMHSWRVAELAALCASILHHRTATPASVLPAVRAFHDVQPLSAEEATALWPLVVLRTVVLVVSGHQQADINPANAYATTSLKHEWRMFDVGVSVPMEVMQAAVRRVTSRQPEPRQPVDGCPLLPDLAGAEMSTVDLSVASERLHPGRWLDADVEPALLEEPLTNGFAAAATRYGEHRLTRAQIDRREPTPTLALGVEVSTRSPQRLVAPWAGTLRRVSSDAIVLDGAGPRLVLAGIASTTDDGDVAAGQTVGVTTEAPLWVQLFSTAEPPPRFVTPELGTAWLEVCPDPAPILPAANGSAAPHDHDLLGRREQVFATLQEHYYSDPPQIEVGWRHHLVDTQGQTYVDALNNVTLLGHGHPRLADAVHAQWRRLNTNSRFHYASLVELSERLTTLLPDDLDTVFLVNSGSEANDLALRLAWAATGRRDVVAVREAYHGWTDATDAISTSVADNPDALASRPGWAHQVQAPNSYRGVHRGDQAHRYAEDAVAQIDDLVRSGRPPAAFICEPFYGNAGGIPLPEGYLEGVYTAVRAAGGLCIADEVQVGYGRLGHWFWGFEQQGVVPDIVTVAKGMGNGHPLGAVITRRDIAESYRSQGYFFSSPGGSPVSSVVGLTVLDVLRDEALQKNALEVGEHLRQRLEELATRHQIIGAVHGTGLYLGVELVRDRVTLEPATAETSAICERLRELGVIVQPTSDRMCVLKIKPPLCVTRASADIFADALDETLTHGW